MDKYTFICYSGGSYDQKEDCVFQDMMEGFDGNYDIENVKKFFCDKTEKAMEDAFRANGNLDDAFYKLERRYMIFRAYCWKILMLYHYYETDRIFKIEEIKVSEDGWKIETTLDVSKLSEKDESFIELLINKKALSMDV